MKNLGLYIHIPFCRSKCLYCDFCSFPHQKTEIIEKYVKRIENDLILHSQKCSGYRIDTVYFGGGTPTCLPTYLLTHILKTIKTCYSVTENAEITVECNPTGSITKENFQALRTAGFNRLSIGLQSVQKKELRALGRTHDFETFRATCRNAREAGFENISADVMFGISYQTPTSFADTLEKLCDCNPEHISAYALAVEDGTPFGKIGAENLHLPNEDDTREMYLYMVDYLSQRGYSQYEISNFAKSGYESRHNLKYWKCEEYLGIGVSAFSDFSGERFGNGRNFDGYLRGDDITAERDKPSELTRKSEKIMLGMRLSTGLDIDTLGAENVAVLERYIPQGLVRKNGFRYAFTPEGMLVSNAILSQMVDFSEDSLVKEQ